KTLRRIGALLRPYRGRAVLGLGFIVLGCLFNLPVSFLIKELVDQALSAGPWVLAAQAVILVRFFAAQAVLNMAGTYVAGAAGLDVVRDLRHRLYSRLQRLSLAYYDRTPSGAIIARFMDDVAAVQALI